MRIALVVIAVAAVVVWVASKSLSPHSAASASRPEVAIAAAEPATVQPASPATLTADAGDAFELHYGLKAEFDAFLFSHQEMPRQAIADAYRSALEHQSYSVEGKEQAFTLFARYLAYKAALSDIDEPTQRQHIQAIADRLDAREQLRHDHFSQQEYHYLFARDAAYDEAALARLRIASDPDMDKLQKQRLIRAQLDSLPDAQKHSFEPSLAVNKLAELTQLTGSENARYQAVAAQFGDEVATRMQSRLRQQSAWKQRVQDYAQWQENVYRDDSLSDKDKTALVDAHRAAHFDDNEVRRLQVYLENPALLD